MISLDGVGLTAAEIAAVAHREASIEVSPRVRTRVAASHDFADRRNGFLRRKGIFFTNALLPMEAAQRAISTIHKLRTAGTQTMVVQHVNVGDGGKAVVAGQIGARVEPREAGGGL